MQSRDFCYWLQGFFEVQSMTNDEEQKPESRGLTPAQVSMIRNHLHLVFAHEIDPAMGDAIHQNKLNQIHSPTSILPGQPVMRC
ncbi:hypothetical protein [Bradyrhizobium sp. SZCCHNRI1073]|uniref:hypothetical protein n=1 Tax=Bradyrhizobium sp. SZCCHNRI1073 TaxID=3057280 RepID=UPI002915FAF4|nr:hypothetical protein [Bradyrhizobium sp. SZCCHNRI1073]